MKKIITVLLLCSCVYLPFAQQLVRKEEAKADIDYFYKTVCDSHYNPFLFISQKKMERKIIKIKDELPQELSMKEMTLIMYQVSALLQDAHANPSISQSYMKEDFNLPLFFPAVMVSTSENLYVPANSAGLPLGAELLRINGIDVKKLYAKIQQNIGGTPQFREAVACKLFSYFLYLENVKPPFLVTCKTKSGVEEVLIDNGVKFKEILSLSMPGTAKPYDFRVINEKIAYLDFRSMSGNIDEFKTFLDQTFSTIKNKNLKVLAVDIRENSGGNSNLGELLISYLTQKKYSLQGGKRWKISQIYKDKLLADGHNQSSYLKQENGTVWEAENNTEHENPFKRDHVFTGKVYLLTGPFTFSSANLLADGMKHYKLAELIGESTGEYTNDFGEAFVFTLPNSKIRMRSTSSFSIGTAKQINKYEVVTPDVKIVPTLEDKINGIDKVLEYVIEENKFQ